MYIINSIISVDALVVLQWIVTLKFGDHPSHHLGNLSRL